jgi:hypothetical protein
LSAAANARSGDSAADRERAGRFSSRNREWHAVLAPPQARLTRAHQTGSTAPSARPEFDAGG